MPYIKMNPPQVYMCSPSWTLLPHPSPYHPSGSSPCPTPSIPYRASNLDWRLVSYMILYIFQCHSPNTVIFKHHLSVFFWKLNYQETNKQSEHYLLTAILCAFSLFTSFFGNAFRPLKKSYTSCNVMLWNWLWKYHSILGFKKGSLKTRGCTMY